jgi:hypothetical protein
MDQLKSNRQTDKQSGEIIPYEISDYINKRFTEEFLSDIKKVNDHHGQVFYNVDISHENTLYHLIFNSKGILVKEDMEPLLESGDDEFDVVAD